MRLTLPIISMVITFCYLLKYSAGQWNTLVNFGSALMPLAGQFSVGGNTRAFNGSQFFVWKYAPTWRFM
jgi:hypothetical protein